MDGGLIPTTNESQRSLVFERLLYNVVVQPSDAMILTLHLDTGRHLPHLSIVSREERAASRLDAHSGCSGAQCSSSLLTLQAPSARAELLPAACCLLPLCRLPPRSAVCRAARAV